MAFRETGDLRFLNTAQRVADYCLSHVLGDYVPYWDFNDPAIPQAPKDSSAAAIALSGLLQSSQLATNSLDAARYLQAAHQVFSSLSSTNCLAQGTPSNGILLHGDSVDLQTDGTDTFAYQVCDSGGDCTSATVTVSAASAMPKATLTFSAVTHQPTISFFCLLATMLLCGVRGRDRNAAALERSGDQFGRRRCRCLRYRYEYPYASFPSNRAPLKG